MLARGVEKQYFNKCYFMAELVYFQLLCQCNLETRHFVCISCTIIMTSQTIKRFSPSIAYMGKLCVRPLYFDIPSAPSYFEMYDVAREWKFWKLILSLVLSTQFHQLRFTAPARLRQTHAAVITWVQSGVLFLSGVPPFYPGTCTTLPIKRAAPCHAVVLFPLPSAHRNHIHNSTLPPRTSPCFLPCNSIKPHLSLIPHLVVRSASLASTCSPLQLPFASTSVQKEFARMTLRRR